jgi:hypothetical protein
MQLYGYSEEARAQPDPAPAALAEVTVVAHASELRRLAEFFTFCANEMDRMGGAYDHIHLSDHLREFGASAHLVVARPER